MYLVDTSIWVHALRARGSSKIQEKLRPLIQSGQAGLTDWIILELMTGIRSDEDQKTFNAFLTPLPRFEINSSCWEAGWKLAVTLRKNGVTPSAADCLIAATAISYQASLIHLDQDFEAIARHSSLQGLNWAGYL